MKMTQLMKLQKQSTRQVYLLWANLLFFEALMVSTLTSQNLSKERNQGQELK